MYFVFAGVIILTYFLGWVVLVVFVGLMLLAWLFAYFDDKRYSGVSAGFKSIQNSMPLDEETFDAEEYFDERGNCQQCGCEPFSVESGVTTPQEIIDFARNTEGWKDNPDALQGWMPPGIYCPNGCFNLHVTPAVSVEHSASVSEIDGIPKPIRIKFADVMRDGGSYALMYDSENSISVKVLLRVISTDALHRIGYRKPQLVISDSPSFEAIEEREIDWDDAIILSKKLEALLSPSIKIGGGGFQRAKEILHYITLKGGL